MRASERLGTFGEDDGVEASVAKFITIGYGDRSGYERTRAEVRDAAHAHDAWLLERGAVMAIAGTAIQVRNHDDGGVKTEEGPYMRSDLPVAGFALIEADSSEEAVELVSHTPCAVAYGVVEVWPLLNPSGDSRSPMAQAPNRAP